MFYFDEFNGKKILKSDLLKDFDCFFTTREFVLTQGAIGELKPVAIANGKMLEEKLNGKINTAVQTHGSNVQIITPEKQLYEDTDALIATKPGEILLMNFADCVPIILYDTTKNIGATVHAGWRGTAAGIVVKTVKKLKEKLNVKPENITALIGPAIGKCCFETSEDVFLQLVKDKNETRFYEKRGEKYFPDLKLLNYEQLIKSGVQNIDICDYCTSCMSGIFFSYRKEKGVTARHSAVIQIKKG